MVEADRGAAVAPGRGGLRADRGEPFVQAWDDNPPAGTGGDLRGTGTGSATPLAWTHAQFIRLVWSIDAAPPVESPQLVSCRYGGLCDSAR